MTKTAGKHRHGWECFKTSGGYANAFEQDRTLAARIETVYKTAYRTGYKNGQADTMDAYDALSSSQSPEEPSR